MMKETPQQYRDRILRLLKGKKALDILASTPEKLAALVKGASRKKLAAKPAPDKWSAVEILAHIADVELVQGVRMRLILGSSGIAIQGFNQDAWAGVMEYASQAPAASLEAYRVNRERTLKMLKSLPRTRWNNYGIHSERGKETLTRVVEMTAGHDLNHLAQLRALLKG
jgi:hypothetical protein